MRFEDIIGNENIKLQLTIASRAAQLKNTAVPHIMLEGAAGCGKTTMAKALAISQGNDFIKIPPESMKTSKDAIDLAENLCVDGYNRQGKVVGHIRPSIVFFDEVHKMPLGGQEALGIAMEEWYVAHKNQYTGEVSEIWLPQFSIIGATTLSGKLSKPFRDRFKLTFHFDTYNMEEAIAIVKMHASLRKLDITDEGAMAVASRSRGVPRLMVSYLERAADAVAVMGDTTISHYGVNSIFNIMGIDNTGLLKSDIKLLMSLQESGIPVGIDTLSIILNESPTTIQNGREPYLIQRGLILRTGRGRMITQKGVEYLKENGHIESKRRFSV